MLGEVSGHAPVAAIKRSDRAFIVGLILLIAALAWAYLVHLDGRMRSSMESAAAMEAMGMSMQTRWGAADVLFAFIMWAVMMIGMMTPAALPVLLLFARMRAGREPLDATTYGVTPAVLLFGVGYLAVWIAFSAGAALAQWALHDAALLSSGMAAASTRVGGAILIAAGAYQLTPAKRACLAHCQSPLGFLLANWRDGRLGAVQMGFRHGIYCLGCCWALMGVLFAVGVMNLAWVAVLSAFVLLEKAGPVGALVARTGGAALLVFGVYVLLR
ncbi:MAG: DUF2182 domain-containing protein [Gemmatimonas sp.]